MEGAWVSISNSPSNSDATCPVFIIKKLIKVGKYIDIDGYKKSVEMNAFLIRGVQYFPKTKTYKIRCGEKVELSYTTLLEKMKRIFYTIAKVEASLIGVHSLRIGGASEAGRAEVQDRLIQQQGRWKTERMQVHYTKPTSNALVSSTKKIMELLKSKKDIPDFVDKEATLDRKRLR
jgi:hypothetical protein